VTQTPPDPHGFAIAAHEGFAMRQRAASALRARGFRAEGPRFLVWDQDERELRAWARELRRVDPFRAAVKSGDLPLGTPSHAAAPLQGEQPAGAGKGEKRPSQQRIARTRHLEEL